MPRDNRDDFIEDTKKLVDLMLATRQWDALDRVAVQNWVGNFSTSTEYFAWRILKALIYYSERDLGALLREALIHKVLGRHVRATIQIPSKFSTYPSLLQYELSHATRRTAITPLLAGDHPAQSSFAVVRSALIDLGIPQTAFTSSAELCALTPQDTDRIIIVDDNAGSGDQFDEFWTRYELAPGVTPASHLSQFAEVHYVVLSATEQGLTRLKVDFPAVTFTAGQVLTPEHSLFDPASTCWHDDAERTEALATLKHVAASRGLALAGYGGLTYAVILHKNIPDWTFPLLWRAIPNEWTPLMTRKNSHA